MIPRITVCVPTYNGSEYLRACLDSILSQTFYDFELLLVDDCSSDSTPAILHEYARNDPRIRVALNEHNRGLVGNWNHSIGLARAEWIKFAFQDDLLRKDCLEKMLAAATRPIVFCRRELLFETGTDEETILTYKTLPGIREVLGNFKDIDCIKIRNAAVREARNFFGEPTSTLIHRSIFDRYGLFNADLAQLCDLEYWLRVSLNTGITYIDEPLATFRYHASSTSAGNRDPLKDERVSVFDNLVMLHEFAYNPHFSSLRQAAGRLTPRRNYRSELAQRATWVHKRACELAKRQGSPDTSWIERWNELVHHYPRMASSPWHLPYWAKSKWAQHVGWRLGQ